MKNNTLNIPVFQVDAFAKAAFTGNPAAVCLLEKAMDEGLMQSIATEMNLSETAFVYPVDNGFNLRWFTPTIEVDLCGHATLATAHVLWEQAVLVKDEDVHFHTRSGLLIAQQREDGIMLDFPLMPATKCNVPNGLLSALGVEDDRTVNVLFNQSDYLVQLNNEEEVHGLQPDFASLAKIKARGVMVTAESKQSHYDFISRFFAPASGINEDPVTGSAHCTLAPFWAGRLEENKMKAFQASPRGGELTVEIAGDRVLLIGKAVTVLEGNLYV